MDDFNSEKTYEKYEIFDETIPYLHMTKDDCLQQDCNGLSVCTDSSAQMKQIESHRQENGPNSSTVCDPTRFEQHSSSGCFKELSSSSSRETTQAGFDIQTLKLENDPVIKRKTHDKVSQNPINKQVGGTRCMLESSSNSSESQPTLSQQTRAILESSDSPLSNRSEKSNDSLATDYATTSNDSGLAMHSGQHISSAPLGREHHTKGIIALSEIQRKRQYRVGLNLFNQKPEQGISYMIERGFLDSSPMAVARFLASKKGLSKKMIGEYLGNLQQPLNMNVLDSFVRELNFCGMQVDEALRKFQSHFIMPGEAQKIDHLMEVFSKQYFDCNSGVVSHFSKPDSVYVLAFAIVMLNTDLHTPTMKDEKRMKLDDFIKNMRGVDDKKDFKKELLTGIFERIKKEALNPGTDHVSLVLKLHENIVGKSPNIAKPHKRLVSYIRLYEVFDVTKKERIGSHKREVFLFNDMLMVTKICSKKKKGTTYRFRESIPLCGLLLTLFEAPHYPHGFSLSYRVDDKTIITFNARNSDDRTKFVEDLKESILEMDEMEALRIETELKKKNQGGEPLGVINDIGQTQG